MSGATQMIHDAILYGSDDDLVAALVPFVRDGLDQGDAAVVALTRRNWELLREALGGDAGHVRFIDRDDWYRRPTVTLAGWKACLDEATGHGHRFARFVGEVNFGPADRHASWTRYESAINGVFADVPAWILCPYDTRTLPASIVESAGRTHPGLLSGSERSRSPQYVAPEAYLTALPEPVPAVRGEPSLRMAIGDSVAAIRRAVRTAASEGGWLSADRLGDLLLALSEVINNSVLYGRGTRALSVWAPGPAVVCEVTDEGGWEADPLVGYRPPDDHASGGMGLWVARQICDALAVETVHGLTRVRLAVS